MRNGVRAFPLRSARAWPRPPPTTRASSCWPISPTSRAKTSTPSSESLSSIAHQSSRSRRAASGERPLRILDATIRRLQNSRATWARNRMRRRSASASGLCAQPNLARSTTWTRKLICSARREIRLALDVPTHAERAELAGFELVDLLDGSHDCAGRSLDTPRAQRCDRFLVAFGQYLHRPVGPIANPPTEAEVARALERGRSIKHALDATADGEVESRHSRANVAGSERYSLSGRLGKEIGRASCRERV